LPCGRRDILRHGGDDEGFEHLKDDTDETKPLATRGYGQVRGTNGPRAD
jgi:hypothetical protein